MCYKKAVLKFFKKLQAYNLHIYFKKDSCTGEVYQIFHSTVLTGHPRVTASARYPFIRKLQNGTLNLVFF